MAVLDIRRVGDKILKTKAEPVEKITGKIKKLIDDMTETMYEAEGVGLAAPQVGVSVRVIVVSVGDGNLWQLVNPEIEKAEGSETDVEGCLSVPSLCGKVERFSHVTVKAVDKYGKKVRINAEGLLARAFQHEIDHLNGILFIEKADDLQEVQ